MTDPYAQPPEPEPPAPYGAPPAQTAPADSAWVTAIGIVGLVLASFGLFGGLCGLGGSAMMFVGMHALAPEDEQVRETLASWGSWVRMTTYLIVDMALAGVLLAGALGLLKRRPWSRRVLMGWAIGTIVAAGLWQILVAVMPGAAFCGTACQKPDTPGGFENMVLGVLLLLMCYGLIWTWAPPIFTLVWFSRDKIKAEVAGWGDSSA